MDRTKPLHELRPISAEISGLRDLDVITGWPCGLELSILRSAEQELKGTSISKEIDWTSLWLKGNI